jgi:hypothetical protein
MDDDVLFWLIIFIVVAVLVCIIGCCSCFAVRCFSPEQEKGALVEVNSQGQRWIRPLNSKNDDWLATEKDEPRAAYDSNGNPLDRVKV